MKNLIIESLSKKINEIVKNLEFKDKMENVVLFGSYANGNANLETSDLNICIQGDIDPLELVEIRVILEGLLEMKGKVHLVRLKDAYEENEELYNVILRDGVIIYAKGK